MAAPRGNTVAGRAENTARDSAWRLRLIMACMAAGWLVLVIRLVHLQGAQRDLLGERVVRQRTFVETVPARPGEILDRNGYVLAMTVTRDSVYAVPAAIDDPWTFAWSAAAALQLNADDVYRRLAQDSERQFVWLRRRVSDDQLAAMRSLPLPRDTWGLRREYLRQYPQGAVAAHVTGIRDIDNTGHGGLEQSLDAVIRGTDGSRVLTRDALGVVVEVAAEQSRSPQHGRSVVSTLDLPVQLHVERTLDDVMLAWKPAGACAIVIRPDSGEVLALASRPAFDPNQLNQIPPEAWKNLAVAAVIEPGSTFKPLVMGRALQGGFVQRDETIDCGPGVLRMGSRLLHDHHPLGVLPLEDVLVRSSNIGMAKIAQRMGIPELYEAVVAFGFGRRTGIELPGEVRGIVRPESAWNDFSLGSVPMGHEIAVTPIQLIAAHAAIANGGRWLRPRLLLDQDDPSLSPGPLFTVETVDAPARVESRVLRRDVADWLVQGPLLQVVERGTARSARTAGLSIFGKTGTAQKFDPESGAYSDSQSVVAFVGGTPPEKPELMVLVVVDGPTEGAQHAGGSVAAPAAAAILKFAAERFSDRRESAARGAE